MSEPDLAPQIFGLWKLIGSADSTGKRSIVRCRSCGSVRTVNAEMLVTSYVAGSGCIPPLNNSSHGRSSESRGAKKRHFGMKDD